MNSNKLMINLVALVKVLEDFQDLKDFMINSDRVDKLEDSSHSVTFLMNSRSSSVEPKEEAKEAHEVDSLDKEEKIL